jgi:hypothetical protein
MVETLESCGEEGVSVFPNAEDPTQYVLIKRMIFNNVVQLAFMAVVTQDEYNDNTSEEFTQLVRMRWCDALEMPCNWINGFIEGEYE